MSRTRKPCPACKEVDTNRAADDICSGCERDLVELKLLREQREREFPDVHVITLAGHWLPYLSGAGDDGRNLQQAFVELSKAVGKHVGLTWAATADVLIEKQEVKWPDEDNCYAYPDGVVEALRAVYRGIQAAVDAAYNDGLNDGRNLLVQIASGEMSIDEINRVTAKDGTRKR